MPLKALQLIPDGRLDPETKGVIQVHSPIYMNYRPVRRDGTTNLEPVWVV